MEMKLFTRCSKECPLYIAASSTKTFCLCWWIAIIHYCLAHAASKIVSKIQIIKCLRLPRFFFQSLGKEYQLISLSWNLRNGLVHHIWLSEHVGFARENTHAFVMKCTKELITIIVRLEKWILHVMSTFLDMSLPLMLSWTMVTYVIPKSRTLNPNTLSILVDVHLIHKLSWLFCLWMICWRKLKYYRKNRILVGGAH